MPAIQLLQSTAVRRIEAAAADQPLMQRAGLAAAELALALLAKEQPGTMSVLVLAGPGNNGGDAFEVARLLSERDASVCVVFVGTVDRLPRDAAAAYQRFVAAGGTLLTSIPAQPRWSLIVDGLFGIGLTRPIDEPYVSLMATANALRERDGCPLLALDCPSGLNADTGLAPGPTIRASHTITFIAHKPGLLTGDGPDHAGQINVADLALEPSAAWAINGTDIGTIVSPQDFAEWQRPRAHNTHKGTFGSAGILGDSAGMVGAALLASRAALRFGAGRVYVGLADRDAPRLDVLQPELMQRAPEELVSADLSALACGPGLGQRDEALTALAAVVTRPIPLVLDADALNLVATHAALQDAVVARTAPTVMTPHPSEAARLLGITTAAVQADRIAATRTLTHRFNAIVALKGCGTIIAAPDGGWFVNTTGNAGLATAGSGDVLTGFTVSLLAQGWPPLPATLAAVYWHGQSADRLVSQGVGPIGLTAGELIDSGRWLRNHPVHND